MVSIHGNESLLASALKSRFRQCSGKGGIQGQHSVLGDLRASRGAGGVKEEDVSSR